MAFDIANDPTTTMKEDKHREWTFPFWRVYAYRNFSLRSGYLAVFNLAHMFWFAGHRGHHGHCLAHIFNGLRVHRWCAQGKIKPHISATYLLERATDALNDLMNRKVKGKAILLTGE